MTGSAGSRAATASLIAPPLLVIAALAIYVISDRAIHIGPFDRAQVGWFVVIPLYLAAPGVLGLAWRSPATRRWAVWESAVIGVSLGLLLVAGLALTLQQIGCQPVTSPWEVVPRLLPGGVAAALGFALPSALAGWTAERRSAWSALVVGAVVACVLFWVTLWTVFIPGMLLGTGCAAPR